MAVYNKATNKVRIVDSSQVYKMQQQIKGFKPEIPTSEAAVRHYRILLLLGGYYHHSNFNIVESTRHKKTTESEDVHLSRILVADKRGNRCGAFLWMFGFCALMC